MKTYSVSKVKQLIDLNGDSVNFEVSFKVSSRNKEPFEILVVDQATLDSDPNLQYKSVTNGVISGKVRKDKNVYQNHFIILKANNPCECDVEIQMTELPEFIQQEQFKVQDQDSQQAQLPIQTTHHSQPVMDRLNSDKNDGFHWIKIILIVGFVAGIGFVLYWVSQKNNILPGTSVAEQLSPQSLQVIQFPQVPQVPQPIKVTKTIPVVGPSRSNSSSSILSERGGRNQILSKLKGLNIDM
jgi:hypothetical protein